MLLPTCDRVQGDQVQTVFGNGGDAALFTGFRLAAAVSRLTVTRAEGDWEDVFSSLRGLHLLTHVSGTPGVLARVAFPVREAHRFGYPEDWRGRLFPADRAAPREQSGRDGPYVYQGPGDVPDVLHAHGVALGGRVPPRFYPPMIFYTRTSRDQLTGVVLGLSVALAELREEVLPDAAREKVRTARAIAAEILEALVLRLEARAMHVAALRYERTHRGPPPSLANVTFVMRDHLGHAGTATTLDPLLKLGLLAAYRTVLRGDGAADAARLREVEAAVEQGFRRYDCWTLDPWTHRLARNYFPWNLRMARLYAVFLHASPERRGDLREYGRRALWPVVGDDGNAWFLVLMHAMERGAADAEVQRARGAQAWAGLQGLALLQAPDLGGLRLYRSPLAGTDVEGQVLPVHLRAATHYFLWQKSPDRTGDDLSVEEEGRTEGTGVDFLLPYWLGRAQGVW